MAKKANKAIDIMNFGALDKDLERTIIDNRNLGSLRIEYSKLHCFSFQLSTDSLRV